MPKPEVNALTLLAVLIAGGLAGRVMPDPFGLMPSLAGVALLIVLFAYDRGNDRTAAQSLAFAFVCGFCLMLACTSFLIFSEFQLGNAASGRISGAIDTHVPTQFALGPYVGIPAFLPALLWLVGTALFFAIDRSRQGSQPSATQAVEQSTAPIETRTAPRAIFPTPVAAQPFTPPAAPPAAPMRDPGPFLTWQATPELSTPAPPLPVQPPPPPPNAVSLPIGAGKPATIYLNLLGAGIACLRSVQAEHLGKDYYRIVEPVPLGENWEFQPGQVVRCQKKNLSSGKALVAIEEAPRAR